MLKISEYLKDKKKFYTQLTVYSDAYYNTGEPLISDQEFDSLVTQYENAFGEKYTYLGKSNNRKVQLPVYMGSLDKCKTDKALGLYKRRSPNTLDRYVVSMKLDGVSALWYTEGTKERLATRGDGTIGSDISHLIPYLNFGDAKKRTGMILRGELIIPIKIFNEKYSDKASNPRNFVAGVVNSKEINPEAIGDLHFVVYHDYSKNKKNSSMSYIYDMQNLARDNWNPVISIVCGMLTVEHLTTVLEGFQAESPYEMDGLVIQNDNLQDETPGENPKSACAFKIDKQGVVATVIGVEWTQSRYSTYHPTVVYTPIILDGVELTRASGVNAKWIMDNKVGTGAVIEVIRSGDVIPKIVRVITPATPEIPIKDYKWKGVDVYTEAATQESLVNKLVSFFDACDAKGLKEGTITKFVEAGYTTIDSILQLSQEQLLRIEGIQIKSAQKILQSLGLCIEKDSIKNRMIGSAMFKGLGDKKIDALLQQPSVYVFLTTGTEPVNFVRVVNSAGIKKNAEEVVNTLKEFKKCTDLSKFATHEPVTTKTVNTGSFSGQTICFTGFRDKKLKEYLTSQGANVTDDITKTTNLLIVKDLESTSSKVKNAQKYSIQIITNTDFISKNNITL